MIAKCFVRNYDISWFANKILDLICCKDNAVQKDYLTSAINSNFIEVFLNYYFKQSNIEKWWIKIKYVGTDPPKTISYLDFPFSYLSKNFLIFFCISKVLSEVHDISCTKKFIS